MTNEKDVLNMKVSELKKINQNEIVEEIHRTYYPQNHFLHNQILHQ